MADAEYHRRWRAEHPEYRQRQNALRNERRRTQGRGDRTAEYAKRKSRAGDTAPLPELFPDLVASATFIFRQEELERDLRQERELAILEGRDPEVACRVYRRREQRWNRIASLYAA